MDCPEDGAQLKSTDFRGLSLDECPTCMGLWFDRDELRRAKDSADKDLRWLDFDPFMGEAQEWGEGKRKRICPKCSVQMEVVPYEKSGVLIDRCKECHGVWLSHGEFEKIVSHLEKEVNSHSSGDYGWEAVREFFQIFTGPEGPKEEMRDLFSVLHLLRTRWAVEHRRLLDIINGMYEGTLK